MASLDLELWDRQLQAYESPATELLFGGASRGGKSHFVRVALVSWCLGIGKLQCTLIRKKFQDILDNHVYGPNGFEDILRPLIATGQARVTQHEVSFANGSRIVFKHCQDERQFDSAQGIASHVLVIDEATQVTERLIRTFRAWCTMSQEMKKGLPEQFQGHFPRIIYTANPIGVSVGFFRRHFVRARKEFDIEYADGFHRQFIPSRVEDNPSEDAEAAKGRLTGINDAATAKALIEGDWNAPTGDFFPEWDEDRHVVADFTPPARWYRYRVYDWGTAEPSYCAWVAVSDGEPFKDTLGHQRWFPRGSIVIYDEWYICDPKDPAKGLRMRNEDMALGIVSRSDINSRNCVTLTDSKPFQDTGGDGPDAAFARCGCPLTKADTSRVAGWTQLRSRLIGIEWDTNRLDSEGEVVRLPMIYICAQCKYARDYIPALGRHPAEHKREDAQEHGEPTHVCDAIRYACMAHNNSVIKDIVHPTKERIEFAAKQSRPTVKKILDYHYAG